MAEKPKRKRSVKALELPESPLAWPIPIAGAIAGLWSALVSLIAILFVMSIGWILTSDSHTEFTSSLQAGVALWLLMHAVPISLGGMVFGLAPLVATFAMVWVLRRAMKWAVRSSLVVNPAGVLLLLFSMAVTYAVIAVFFSLLITDNVQVNASRLILASTGWALIGGVWGIASSKGVVGPAEKRTFNAVGQRTEARIKARAPFAIVDETWNSIPSHFRLGIITGARLSVVTLLLGALMMIVMLVVHFSDLNAVIGILSSQSTSHFAIILLTLVYLPTVAIWMSSLIIGPGFVVGGGSAVTMITQVVGPLPAVPFLALIPTQLPWVMRLLLVLPAVAAFIVGNKRVRANELAGFIVATATTSALLNAWISTLASGELGSGRFQLVGISLVQTFVWTFFWTVLGLVARALMQRRFPGKNRAPKKIA